MYTDKTLTCRECGANSSSPAPSRLSTPASRMSRPLPHLPCQPPQQQPWRQRQMYDVICDECGATTQSPSSPR